MEYSGKKDRGQIMRILNDGLRSIPRQTGAIYVFEQGKVL